MLARVLSGLVMGVGVLALLLLAPWWAFVLFTAIVALIGHDEYHRMVRPDGSSGIKWLFALIPAWFCLEPALIQMNVLQTRSGSFGWTAAFLLIALVRLSRALPLETSVQKMSFDLLGVMYLGATLPALIQLRLLDLEQGWGWVLLTMLVTFGGDTGGYFAGRALGKHKLAPKLSPKKTIEGYLGGVALGGVGVWVAQSSFAVCADLTLIDGIILGGVGVSLGVAGDLFESMLKRATGVKDSGTLIPGHGGVLDRVDALLFVSPFIYFYLTTLKPLLAS